MPPVGDLERILEFLAGIGIEVAEEALGEDTLLPAITVRHGTVVFDPARLDQPGDLLHEAGHVAVMERPRRTALATVADDPGEEMAAIAWSNAAAAAIGLDPRVVFHDAGYRGDGAWLAESFAQSPPFGVPLLAWYGMTDATSYPRMTRWLR